ncbi:competence type IV pilus ATPase ComGA [Halobacillus sp. A5]|uniref:competence type IV pilus ATPase ComGA n=1 Tax=Halobacillus sp. A5 TaxID=2880263 RepID=UPI0020A63046|nr:competence type IV pilus ATPase ComGA [Halobacillus sp. A5]MCP3025700.1 Flp pilus assembly complex ATPase component TadA [Halobacillus sp. A5]
MSHITDKSRKLLASAIEQSASDVHFSPNKEATDVYFRVFGQRVRYTSLPNPTYQKLLAYFKFTSGMDIGEITKPQNASLEHRRDNLVYHLRLSTLPTPNSESLAIRILPSQEQIDLSQLFLFPNQLQIIKKWIKHKSGMILFTGPTGSGKTTTMYSLVQTILQEQSLQAITLEDPMEKKLDHIVQVQVNERAGITYDAGLKAALRHDPDLIMVGEIRDKETAQFAIRAALSGHLIISTIHAKNAYGTLQRLKEMNIKTVDLEQTMIAIACQELINLQLTGNVPRRAAILEVLESSALQRAIHGIPPSEDPSFQPFELLRRKAHALGFYKNQ